MILVDQIKQQQPITFTLNTITFTLKSMTITFTSMSMSHGSMSMALAPEGARVCVYYNFEIKSEKNF